MKPVRSLRIPAALTWTTLVACSGGGSSPTQADASRDVEVRDAPVAVDVIPPEEATVADAQPDGSTVDAEVHPVCQEVTDSTFVYFTADGGSCPDGDSPVVV